MTDGPRLQLLDDADQALSDRAADACGRASEERRTIAWREANRIGQTTLEKTCIYGAYCLCAEQGAIAVPRPQDVEEVAERLEAIHIRHQRAVEARATDAVG